MIHMITSYDVLCLGRRYFAGSSIRRFKFRVPLKSPVTIGNMTKALHGLV